VESLSNKSCENFVDTSCHVNLTKLMAKEVLKIIYLGGWGELVNIFILTAKKRLVWDKGRAFTFVLSASGVSQTDLVKMLAYALSWVQPGQG